MRQMLGAGEFIGGDLRWWLRGDGTIDIVQVPTYLSYQATRYVEQDTWHRARHLVVGLGSRHAVGLVFLSVGRQVGRQVLEGRRRGRNELIGSGLAAQAERADNSVQPHLLAYKPCDISFFPPSLPLFLPASLPPAPHRRFFFTNSFHNFVLESLRSQTPPKVLTYSLLSYAPHEPAACAQPRQRGFQDPVADHLL